MQRHAMAIDCDGEAVTFCVAVGLASDSEPQAVSRSIEPATNTATARTISLLIVTSLLPFRTEALVQTAGLRSGDVGG